MATTVGQHQVSTITDPADGSSMVASTMRTATNAVRSGANDHDNDSGIHFQSSVAGSRPAAGTAGRKWLDTDTLLIKYDNGSSWADIAYLKSTGGTVTGAVTISSGGLTVSAGGLTVSAGGAAVTGNSTITGDLTVTGALAPGSITGVTTLAGIAKITSNATSWALRDNADSADIIKYTAYGDALVIGNTAAVDTITIESDAVTITSTGVDGTDIVATKDITLTSSDGNVLLGIQGPGLFGTETKGFAVIGNLGGVPSGVASTGALLVDSLNNRLYVNIGGTWKYASLT